MGNNASSMGSKGLSAKDVDRLQRRFTRLADAQGTVEIAQFQGLVELGGNPFTARILQLFDKDKDNRLTADEFGAAMEYFGNLGPAEEQYKFAFKIYDLDGDGIITGPELHSTLGMLMGRAYTPEQLEQVVMHTLREFDKDGDNGLNLDEFKSMLDASDLTTKLAVSMS